MNELSKTSPHLKSVQQNNKRILADLSGNEDSAEPRRKANRISEEQQSPNASRKAVTVTPAKSPQVPKFQGLSSQKHGNELDFIPASQLQMNL